MRRKIKIEIELETEEYPTIESLESQAKKAITGMFFFICDIKRMIISEDKV